ncbi:DUF5596 domain-containing protein [bacterium]|nr:DUF5596 domain-containing protein [bacterium]
MDNLEQILEKIGQSEALELFQRHWRESMSCYPASGPHFLAPDFVEHWMRRSSCPADAVAPCKETAGRIRENPDLARLAWHCYRLAYTHLDYTASSVHDWPDMSQALPDHPGLFFFLLILASGELTEAVHRQRGIPDEYTVAGLKNIPVALDRYAYAHGGALGAESFLLYWYRNHTSGELYRIGRFQYKIIPLWERAHVLRRRETGETIALATDGTAFTPDGSILQDQTKNTGWTARFLETDAAFIGCPISPAGPGLQTEIELPRSEWESVLRPGDSVLDIHIPPGGRMGLDVVKETLDQAAKFFRLYFPERPIKGFCCASWILNPDLEQILWPDSNLALLQREVYLLPWPSQGQYDGCMFVFCEKEPDPERVPRETRLQTCFADHMLRGGRLLTGGMIFLLKDLDQFGTQYYRKHFPPELVKKSPA